VDHVSERPDVPVDPLLAAILQKRIEAITAEMATALIRSARSMIFNLVGDFITAALDAEGRTLAQTEHAAVIAFGAEPSLLTIREYFGDDIAEGDVIAHNDVFSRGNQNHDLGLFAPVFYEGTLQGWVVVKGHQADLGGSTLGGYDPASTEVWQEALRITPVKLYQAGEVRRDVWDLIFANQRLDIVPEDVKSMIGACVLGVRNFQGLFERYGTEVVVSHLNYVIDRSEQLVRDEIATWPDGTYRGESWMVSDGIDATARYRIVCEVTIAGDEITFDFSETDDQSPGYANMPASAALGSLRIVFLMLLTAGGIEVPPNHGLFGPVHAVFREGSLLDPTFPAATMFGNQMCDEVLESIMTALAPVLPDRVVAGWNQALGTVFACTDPRNGQRTVFFGAFHRGGPGGCYGGDGFDALGFSGSVGQMTAPDIEAYEIGNPVRMESYEYTPDSAGAGCWRGGYGTTTVRTLLADDVRTTTFGDDVAIEGAPPALGFFGGEPAGLNEIRLEYPDGSVHFLGSKAVMPGVPINTVVRGTIGGGAGYGDPYQRPLDLVVQEVSDGLLSLEKARSSYGVVIDASSGQLDKDATEALRASPRAGV
jgi:N-methylhydantoinase B